MTIDGMVWGRENLGAIIRPGEEKAYIIRQLDEIMTKLAADYYRAGNP